MARRQCEACGASWPRATSRWCGRCGAALTGPRGVTVGRTRPRGAVVLGLLAVLGVAVGYRALPPDPLAAGDPAMPGDVDVQLPVEARPGPDADPPRAGVTPSDPDTDPDAASDPAGGRGVPREDSCFPQGCAAWQVDGVDHRNVWVGDGLVVHASRDGMLALDPHTGEVRWQRPTASDAAQAWSHDLRGAVGGGLVAVADGPRLLLFDATDGHQRTTTELPFARASELAWLGDRLLVAGGPVGQGSQGELLVVDVDGAVLGHHVGTPLLQPERHPAPPLPFLATPAGGIQRVSLVDGRVDWEAAGPYRFAFVGQGGIQAVADGRVDRIDADTGEVTGSVATDVHEGADPFSAAPWVLVEDTDRRTAVDPATGEVAFERAFDPDVHRGLLAEPLGRRILGIEVLASGRELLAFVVGADGAIEDEARLRLPAGVALADRPLLEVVDVEAGLVDLVLGRGRSVVRLRTDPLRVAYERHLQVADSAHVDWRGGLTFVRQDGLTRVYGSGGQVELPGSVQVASADPLLVHGGVGLVRVDRDLLDAPT
ncbi:hypothetical protein [Egicoccus sp. AB-alg2]|uniref:hypothetical protein n=1 Tax=Egicoccus sp. AB-alg2 TaxID=3242693 RepID=UPI00359E822E